MSDDLVLYHREEAVATVTLNRPDVHNAQNGKLLYELDRKLGEAVADDDVSVIVLRGAGPSFSAGHDIGKGRDADVSFPRLSQWPDHVGKPAIQSRLYREEELYLELTRRWRDIPKPTIAAVHGGCIGAGLMLAWACDIIVAAEDAYFADPVLRMGAPGVEFFAHPWQMRPRFAKELLFLGERIPAQRAYELGMVNRVVATDEMPRVAVEIASRVAEMPLMALMLAKKSVNVAEEAMGFRLGMEHAFALHQLSHAHIEQASGHPIGGATPRATKAGLQGEDVVSGL